MSILFTIIMFKFFFATTICVKQCILLEMNCKNYVLAASQLYKRFSVNANVIRKLSGIKEVINVQTDRNGISNKRINKYSYRTHTCDQLRLENVGEKVILCGWLQYQRLNKFAVVRDGYGVTQLLVKENDLVLQNILNAAPYESILKIEGTVVARPIGMINKTQNTGNIEVLLDDICVLNRADENLPFNLRSYNKPKEPLRMKYRYLDMRFPEMQRNLRERSLTVAKMREYLIYSANFVDVETPTLFKATPGGAQEYIVPTRFSGQFYSLVQSPQQFKQMLMAGAIDRYFQIARCYRDEGSRSDRQPEFTQLDIEMSFTTVYDIMALVEDLLRYSWPAFLKPLPDTFPRITFQNSMEKYGCDKPDLRFGFELKNITNILMPINTGRIDDFYSSCLIIQDDFKFSSSMKNKLKKVAEDYPNVKFIQTKIYNKSDWITKVAEKLSDVISYKLWNTCDLKMNNIFFLAYGSKTETLALMGKIRNEMADLLEDTGYVIRNDEMQIVWITEFPLFERDSDNNLVTVHHPFTAPHPEDLDLLDTSPLSVRSLAYDLVLNGNEIGGGSIRIHDSSLQTRILQLLKINISTLGHMIQMLSSGCPPHGGIALGLDRFMSTILKTQSIRDVIAFPKTVEGRDPMSGAPSEITEKEKAMYHISTVSKNI